MSEWKKVKIGDFLTESRIIAEESDAAHRITVRLNCKGVEQRSLKAEKEGATKYYTRKAGQFIYGKQNIHKGAFGIIPQELDGFTSSADLPTFDVDLSKCIPEWICICLQKDEYYKSLQKNVKGVGSQRLAVNVFLDSEIPLPSVEKQEEIIKKIKLQLQKAEQLAVELELQKNYIKQLHQNILQDAIEGKLTADWRKQNPIQKGNPDYDAEALFEQIQKERNNEKKQKELSPITDEEKPFEIPESWKWVRLGEISLLITDGKHGDSVNQNNSGYFFLSAKDIQNGELIYTNARQITEKDFHETHRRTNLEPGDICIVNTGATVGKLAIAPDNPKTYMTTFQKSVAVVKLVKNLVSNIYIKFFLLFDVPKLMATSWGSAINNLLLSDMKKEPIPLPPFAEQKEIVIQVEKHLKTVAELEKQITEREQLSKQLMQSILKDAFEEN